MHKEKIVGIRADLAFIAHWVNPGSRVLDLGCGDGSMMYFLQEVRQCYGYGVEIDSSSIPYCIDKGVSVIQQDIESGLAMFADDVFDVVLCLSALQMIKNVEETMSDIARVGREMIVSFPNFGFWSHRLSLLLGKTPVSNTLPFQWFDTPNLRYATVTDFEKLANNVGLEVLDCISLTEKGVPVKYFSNLRGSLAIFRLKKRKI